MSLKVLTLEDAKQKASKLEFSLVRSLSDLYLSENKPIDDFSEVIEAHFFSESEEIRFFRKNGELLSCQIDEENEEFLTKSFKVIESITDKEISVYLHIGYDEDGQAYIKYRRLADLKGRNEK